MPTNTSFRALRHSRFHPKVLNRKPFLFQEKRMHFMPTRYPKYALWTFLQDLLKLWKEDIMWEFLRKRHQSKYTKLHFRSPCLQRGRAVCLMEVRWRQWCCSRLILRLEKKCVEYFSRFWSITELYYKKNPKDLNDAHVQQFPMFWFYNTKIVIQSGYWSFDFTDPHRCSFSSMVKTLQHSH